MPEENRRRGTPTRKGMPATPAGVAKAPSQRDVVYAKLFERILSGRLKDRMRLVEKEVADEFGISRGPVREVFHELARDGLLEITRNHGAIVYSFTADDVEDLFEVRKVIELLALEYSIANISLQQLTEIRLQIQESLDSADVDRLTDIDEELHGCIANASARRRIIFTLDQLTRLLRPFRILTLRNPEIVRRQQQDHFELIDKLMVRDLEASKEVLKAHIEFGKISVLSFLVKNHSI
jgi:GntR family transcriptional regulator, rspAB operon transcriptional repressor